MKATKKLKEDTLSEEERTAYRRFQENRRIERSEIETALKEGEEKGIEKRDKEIVVSMHSRRFSVEQIVEITHIPTEKVTAIIHTTP